MSDLEIIMAYTGWSKEIARSAVRQWRAYDPKWNAQHVLQYLEVDYGEEGN